MDKNKNFRIGIYIRVSTDEQAENPEGSIKSQEQRLRQHVHFKNQDGPFGEIKGVFIDRAKSGKDTNRPELQRLIRAVIEEEINLILVTELSRLSRSMRDFSEIWEILKSHKCSFQSLRENFDTTTAAGEMVLFSLANIAQYERKQVAERVAANMAARAARGLYNGGSVPFGYKLISDKPGYLDVDGEASLVVKACFKAFIQNETLSQGQNILGAG